MGHKLRWMVIGMVLAVCVQTQAAAQSKPQKLYAWGSSPSTSSFYLQYTAFAQVLNKYLKDVQFTVVETGGSEDNVKKLRSGEISAGLIGVEAGFDAYNGFGKYKDARVKDIRVLLIHNLSPQGWAVTADSGIKTLKDLEGKAFAAGGRGSTTEVLAKSALEALGIKPKYLVGSMEDILDATKDGRITGFVKSQPSDTKLDASTVEINNAKRLNFLGFSPEEREKIKKAFPVISSWMTVNKGAWAPGQPEVLVYTTTVAVGTTTGLDNDLAYRMIDTIIGRFDEVVEKFPALKGADIPALTLNSAMPLHPSTVKWLQAHGKKVPAHLIVK